MVRSNASLDECRQIGIVDPVTLAARACASKVRSHVQAVI